jgi:hypothetical protein
MFLKVKQALYAAPGEPLWFPGVLLSFRCAILLCSGGQCHNIGQSPFSAGPKAHIQRNSWDFQGCANAACEQHTPPAPRAAHKTRRQQADGGRYGCTS